MASLATTHNPRFNNYGSALEERVWFAFRWWITTCRERLRLPLGMVAIYWKGLLPTQRRFMTSQASAFAFSMRADSS
jgi:hypothetical protein